MPSELEKFVEEVVDSGIQQCVAAVGLDDPVARTAAVHVMIEYRHSVPPDVVADRVRAALADAFGLSGVTVHWVPKGTLPKTTSGKTQRFLCRGIVEAEVRKRYSPRPQAKTAPEACAYD